MSSSVFAKSPVSTNESRTESNLVVVYGKNGINVDRKELQNLVDEKSLATISVIRLTSPTPSMEEETEIKEDKKVNDDEDKDNDEPDNDEKFVDNEEDSFEGEDDEEDDDEVDELLATLKGIKHKKRVKPENVGLTLEKFYLPDQAKKIAKDILNVSGVNRLLVNIDYDLQRLAIQNDHCYTPLTSPNQLHKTKKSEKTSQMPSTSKVNQQKQNLGARSATENLSSESNEDKSVAIDNPKQSQEIEDDFEDDDSDYEIESLDTDNDRDSDLDFNVYDRNSRKQRKTSTKKITNKRLSVMTKVPKKRKSLQTEQNYLTQEIEDKKLPTRNLESKSSVKPSSVNHQNITQIESSSSSKPIKYLTNPVQPKTITTIPIENLETNKVERQLPVQKNHLVKLPVSNSSQIGRAIVQDVIIIKPPSKLKSGSNSGGFTDVSKYLQKIETNKSNVKFNELIKPENRNPSLLITRNPIINNNQDQSKVTKQCFMPIEIDAAIKNQLPSQISIQTHQSSSELLAAEDDKQLDLIDSIVKKEMEKSNIIDKDLIKKNENIPKLVKMLESTENTIFSQQQLPSVSNIHLSMVNENTPVTTFTNSVEDIDIANAPLLDTPEDEIPEDLLKDVSELIDNKTLQEFVEKQSLIQQQQQSALVSITDFEAKIPSVLVVAPEKQQNIIIQDEITPTNVDIKPFKQLSSISNINSPNRPELIQVMQRNGKVITLPPIEAPTTRAKRRAAAQHQTSSSNEITANISVGFSDVDISSPNTKPTVNPLGTPVNQSALTPRRNSKDQVKSAELIKKQRASTSSQNIKNNVEIDANSNQEDDDDPNKLWCICRQPHNNRFMICCDVCEDWFHGACVNVTKAMGLEMEQKGIEWTCPKCLKSKKPTQKKITDLFEKKPHVEKKTPFPPQDIKKGTTTTTTTTSTTPTPTPNVKKQPAVDVKKKIFKRKASESNISMEQQVPKINLNQSVEMVSINQSVEMPAKPIKPIQTSDQISQQSSTKIYPMSITIKNELSPKIEETLHCIVCKKVARSNSIYCSDECIRKHAYNALVTKVSKTSVTQTVGSPTTPSDTTDKKKKTPSSFEEALAIASDLQPKKIERVYVYERKSGRLLTGNNAPTTNNLKKWLQDNPTFEVVQPGSPQAIAIEAKCFKNKQIQRSQPSTSTEIIENSQNSPGVQELNKVIKSPTIIKFNNLEIKSYMQKIPQLTPDKTEKSKILKKPTTGPREKSSSSKESQPKKSEPIRLNVKRTLKEQLTLRMNELKDGEEHEKLKADEIEKFAKKTEEEMFKLFNKDTGTKYKAKYRSLSFNLKDRKNKTLFKKICEKLIEPHELVRMSPEQLASQELAQWRQNENKHQLEMIKKSELDLLSCAKNYVLKTHKGEEVIESKITDRLNLDITIPVEDVVTVLNNSIVSSTSELEQMSPVKDPYRTMSSFEQSFEMNKNLSITNNSYSSINKSFTETSLSPTGTTKISSDKKKSSSKDRENRDKRHKNKNHRHKDRRSRSRSRDRSKHIKSPHKDDKHEQNKKKQSKIHDSKHDKITPTTITKQNSVKISTTHKEKNETKSKLEIPQAYSLIDQILESSKTVEEAANLKAQDINAKKIPSSSTTNVDIRTKEISGGSFELRKSEFQNDNDEEPTSTVSITTPPQEDYGKYSSDINTMLWSGSINMIDVATFQIGIQPVSGIFTDLDKDLPNELDVVGRIGPDTVWDYISKIKQSPNKEVVIVRLVPSSETENIAYSALYMYLDKRKRLGVVKTVSPSIKDFYILPLGSRKLLPSVLEPVSNPQFFEDVTRPNLLLGIVIRIMGITVTNSMKRPLENVSLKKVVTTVISKKSSAFDIMEEDHYTPPGSPSINTKNIISRLPLKLTENIALDSVTSQSESKLYDDKMDDADEPYSPGGSTEDEDISGMLTPSKNPISDQNELKRKMDEINRQIEAQQQEIAGMLGTDAYSPTDSTTSSPNLAPALANISIPSNLQQILASIQTKPEQHITSNTKPHSTVIGSFGAMSKVLEDESVYKPIANNTSSRLAQLSEAELLSMVPDDIEINKIPTESSKYSSPKSVQPPLKKARWDVEPPPPGLEDEFN